MIPQEQLSKLKPIPDQLQRAKAIKRKQNRNSPRKKHLTKRARQNAWFPGKFTKSGYNGPKGSRWKGTPKKKK